MATYNCVDTVAEAVTSILEQTYKNWELVICDDCSGDGTYAVLEDVAAQNRGRVVLLRNQANSKLSFSLNRCLEVATGDLIARMDGDDRCSKDRLRCQVDHLVAHPEVDVVGTAYQRFNDQGLADVVQLDPFPDRYSLRYGVPFVHATIMMRRAAFDRLGGYTVSTRTERGQDLDLWFRFFAAGFTGHNLQQSMYLVREDGHAVRRRTLRVRYRIFRTTLMGYRMLDFPKSWYVWPFVMVLKGLVPTKAVLLYRTAQRHRFDRSPLQASSR